VDPIQADERRTWEEVTVTPLTSNLIRVFLLTVLFPTLLGFRTKLLVIDPILRWNTFLGGLAFEEADDIIIDGNGDMYLTGYSDGTWGNPIRPFSTTPDAFVAKLNAQGTLEWNTFLGGSGGDLGYGIALDANGDVYVTGNSSSTWGNPIQPFVPGISDVFVARLDGNGNLTWSTFLGGRGMDEARESAVHGGTIYVTGRSDAAWGLVTMRPIPGAWTHL
jgi:hypothetical protein